MPKGNCHARRPRRHFRDPDDAKIGGVISGLCHYFGISDPVWIRIAAIALLFLSFFSITFLYLLLLVIIPKANTAAEKLQMKGEPVNINTIEKEIKEAAGRATDSVHRMLNEQNVFERLWGIVVSILTVLAKLFAILSKQCLRSGSLPRQNKFSRYGFSKEKTQSENLQAQTAQANEREPS